MHYSIKLRHNKNSPIWIKSKYRCDCRCDYQARKREFPNVTPVVKSVSACLCFCIHWRAEIRACLRSWSFFKCVCCVVQQLWETTFWRTPCCRLAPALPPTTLCWPRASPRLHPASSTPPVSSKYTSVCVCVRSRLHVCVYKQDSCACWKRREMSEFSSPGKHIETERKKSTMLENSVSPLCFSLLFACVGC